MTWFTTSSAPDETLQILEVGAQLPIHASEAILGEAGVAAPIFDHSGHAVGAVGVVGDSERIVPRGPREGPRRRGRRGGRRHLPRARSALLAGTGRAAPR